MSTARPTRSFSLLLSPSSARRRLQAGCLLVLLLIAILLVGTRNSPHPSWSEVERHLTSALHPLPLRIVDLRTTFSTPSAQESLVRFDALLEATAPLYIWSPEALTSLGGPDLTSAESAASLLRGPPGRRIRTALSLPEPPPALASVVVVTPPVGTRLPYAAAFIAQRAGRGWPLGPIDRRLDPDPERVTITLRTRGEQRLPESGPCSISTSNWSAPPPPCTSGCWNSRPQPGRPTGTPRTPSSK